MEILTTLEVVLQSTFSRFLFQLLGYHKVSWASRPSTGTRFCPLVLTQHRGGFNIPTSITNSISLFYVTWSLSSGTVLYTYMFVIVIPWVLGGISEQNARVPRAQPEG